jgi:flagellin
VPKRERLDVSGISLLPISTRLLHSLRETSDLATEAQGRLGSGLKIDEAADDPGAFLLARGLSSRAGELSQLLDSVSQAVSAMRAASEGLSAIDELTTLAKAEANKAAAATDPFARADHARAYNELLGKIEDLARDSGYAGRNLVGTSGETLTIRFGSEPKNALSIESVDYTDVATSLGLERLDEGSIGRIEVPLGDGGTPLAPDSPILAAGDAFTAGTLTLTNADGTVGSITITPEMKVSEFVSKFNAAFDGTRASFRNGTLTIEAAEPITISGGTVGGPLDGTEIEGERSSWHDRAAIEEVTLPAMRDAISRLREHAAALGSNLAMVERREDFTKMLRNALSGQVETLTAADDEEEAANVLALDLRRQFATTALSLTSDVDSSVLRLLGG